MGQKEHLNAFLTQLSQLVNRSQIHARRTDASLKKEGKAGRHFCKGPSVNYKPQL